MDGDFRRLDESYDDDTSGGYRDMSLCVYIYIYIYIYIYNVCVCVCVCVRVRVCVCDEYGVCSAGSMRATTTTRYRVVRRVREVRRALR